MQKNTKIITEYLSSKGLEAASFDVNELDEFLIALTDEIPFMARLELIAATKELHDVALGLKEGLRCLACDVRFSSDTHFLNTALTVLVSKHLLPLNNELIQNRRVSPPHLLHLLPRPRPKSPTSPCSISGDLSAMP